MRRNFCLMPVLILLSVCIGSALADGPVSQRAPFLVTLNVPNAPGKDYFDLDQSNSSFDVTIKNITSLPQTIWKDSRPPGYDSVTLYITAINGCKLLKPAIVAKEMHPWAANFSGGENVYPEEEIEQHIYLYELRLLYYVPSVGDKEYPFYDSRLISGIRLPRLSGTNSSLFETITVYATFSTLDTINTPTGTAHWSGQVASAPITFKTGL